MREFVILQQPFKNRDIRNWESLNNQEWASRLSESAKQIVVDSKSGTQGQ